MYFESCSDDPRSGNTLTSPEFTLQSDEQLTFTALSPTSNNNDNSGLGVYIYRTEVGRHPALLLSTLLLSSNSSTDDAANSTTTYTPPATPTAPPVGANDTDNNNATYDYSSDYSSNADYNFDYSDTSDVSSSFVSYAKVSHGVCLPAGTYQLVFKHLPAGRYLPAGVDRGRRRAVTAGRQRRGLDGSRVQLQPINRYTYTLHNNTDSSTSGNLIQHHCHCDLRDFNFTNRVIPIWNSLSDYVVSAEKLTLLKTG